MHKVFKIFEDYFAYFSIGAIITIILILLFNSTGINTIAIISIVIITTIYAVLFLKSPLVCENISKIQNENEIFEKNEPAHNGYHATIDEEFNITHFSNSFASKYIKDNGSLLGKNLFQVLHIDPKKVLQELNNNGNFSGIVGCSRDNKQLYKSLTIEATQSTNKEYYITFFDVTSSIKTDEELREQYLVDKFTGLSSKSQLLDDASRCIKSTFNANTLIFIKVDSFDEINEFFGIDAGNKITAYVANWLSDKLPTEQSKLYKLDRDSFAILITTRFSSLTLKNYLKIISNNIKKETFYFQNIALNISFTIGAAKNKDNLVRYTYHTLHDAKNLKQSYKIFNKDSKYEEKFIHNIKMNQTIKDAILENRIEPFFQPIYNIKTDEIEKFESLIRIQTRNGSYLRPADFLDIAKKSNLYLDLSRAMIKSTLNKLEKLNFPVTINISAYDILDKRVSGFILRHLENNNNGHLVTFEIVESEELDNNIKIANFLKKIKLLGCKIAIDDFGSGYSNFSQIPKLNADYLKIDGSLIKDINTNPNSLIMVKSMVSFAKDLGIQTIAEYVSSKEIFDKVKLLGVDYAQGYHIGRPSHILG